MNRSLQVLSLGLALLTGSACAGPRLAPVVENAPALRVVSWNVNYGLAGDPVAIAFLEKADGDVVLLQETTPPLERAIRKSRVLTKRYPHMAFHNDDGPGGLAVLSKYAIVHDEILPEVTWFPAWRGVIDGPVGKTQILNVHLRPPFDDKGSMVSGYFVTPAMRREEMTTFAAMLDDTLPTIVAGDFNEGSGDAVNILRERGMISVLEAARDSSPTWRWAGVPIRLRLDHVFADDELAVTEASVVEAGNSDHLPIVATFQRAQPKPARAEPTSTSPFSPLSTGSSGGSLSSR